MMMTDDQLFQVNINTERFHETQNNENLESEQDLNDGYEKRFREMENSLQNDSNPFEQETFETQIGNENYDR